MSIDKHDNRWRLDGTIWSEDFGHSITALRLVVRPAQWEIYIGQPGTANPFISNKFSLVFLTFVYLFIET